MEEKLITIGKITRHQGNKGEVKVQPLTDWPERFNDLDEVYLIKKRVKKKLSIERVREHKNAIVIKFDSFNNIEQAIEHKEYYLKIPEAELIKLPKDDYFYHDIIGLNVYTKNRDSLGVIEEIIETKANDVYIVRDENSELLIPAIKTVILEVDIDKGEMTVKLPPGLR